MTPWTKRLALALAISVAMNLLFAGFLLGRGARSGPRGDFGRALPREPSAALPGRKHGPWRGAFERHGPELRTQQDQLRAARRAAREALLQPNFDAARLETSLAAVRAETTKSQELLHRSLAEAAATAAPSDRKDLAKALDGRGR